jgi:valyl-tRNA synthetase
MSKSLGNSPDLLELIDKYGADAVRFGIMISSPAGNDLLFDEASLEQGRNFNNKLWNALKLVKLWEERVDASVAHDNGFALVWFENRLRSVREETDLLLKQFKLSEALKIIYSLIWDDFCSWYLEWIKPGFEKPIAKKVYEQTIYFFEQLMQLLHPFMPFVTEELYHLLAERSDDLCVKQFETVGQPDNILTAQGELLQELITALREFRTKSGLKARDRISVYIDSAEDHYFSIFKDILQKQLGIENLQTTETLAGDHSTIVIKKDTFHITSGAIVVDNDSRKQELRREIEYLQGFLVPVNKKLENEKFVQNAKPEVLALEKKKKEDAEAKIKVLEESLTSLS